MRELDTETIHNLTDCYSDRLKWYKRKYRPFKRIAPITEGVCIARITDSTYALLWEHHARAWCNSDNGKIYIRNDAELTGHLLMHEYIHRMSRKRISKVEYSFGFEGDREDKPTVAFSEALTEWVAIDITMTSSPTSSGGFL